MHMLRKFSCSVVILLLVSITSNAQQSSDEKTESIFLATAYGASIPFGNFASSDPYDIHSGYAQTAFNRNYLNVGFLPKGRLGLHLNVFSTRFKFRIDDFTSPLSQTEYPYEGRSERWEMTALVGGFMYSILLKNASLDLKVSAGVTRFTRPKIVTIYTDTASDPPLPITWEQLENRQVQFMWGGGLNFRYFLTPGFHFITSLDYLQTDIYYEVRNEYKPGSANFIYYNYWDVEQSIRLLNIGFGFALYIH